MENSIEEDIKIINNFITYFNKNIQNGNKADLTVLGEEINALEHILSDYKRVLKENEELKEKENKIYKEVHESLAFEKFLIVKERKPDLFNQGRFYISQIIYDILNDVQNPEGIHKENKCIQYIDYIPVQIVKDKIKELNSRIEIYWKYVQQGIETDVEWVDNVADRETVKVLQELIEEREEK